MNSQGTVFAPLPCIPALCRGDRNLLSDWVEGGEKGCIRLCLVLITVGFSLYGFTIGLRNGLQMGAYVAIKFPAVIFGTLALNVLLNGMLAVLLGSGLSFRQSLKFLLMGFAIMATMLGALSPIIFFATLNMPPPDAPGSKTIHGINLLLHTLLVTYAGIHAHAMMYNSLLQFTRTRLSGILTYLAWLAGNLFVGAQVSWVLRPYLVAPGYEVEFLRKNLFDSNFYEAIYRSARNVFF